MQNKTGKDVPMVLLLRSLFAQKKYLFTCQSILSEVELCLC